MSDAAIGSLLGPQLRADKTALKKTSTRLADGRELIYFDSADVLRRAEDRRPTVPRHSASKLRYDPLLETWVIYASHRQDRSYLPDVADCPLCPSGEGRSTEVPDADYEVVVFENRFSALAASTEEQTGRAVQLGPELAELFVERPAAGRCEVVCFTADHDASFAELTPRRVDLVVEALVDRSIKLGALPGVEQVFCFENRGREIGVTQPHPHGQIYAYPFLTPRTERMLAAARAYHRRTRRNLFDDVVAAERSDGSRVVLATEHWTAFVPHAARWPFELHCYPNRRVPDLAALDDDQRAELPEVLLDIFGRFSRLFSKPAPYIAGWHQAPVREGRRHFALHLELFSFQRAEDKLKFLAGSESGMDVFANDIVPEDGAARLRGAKTPMTR
jgi:UDPglucose--hexose-1-phosphate uridylyltransferase